MTRFHELTSQITRIGVEWHGETIVENSIRNRPHYLKSIRDIKPHGKSAVVVSAGPSLYRNNTLERLKGYKGVIVAIDGSYIRCLKAGVLPDYVLTLDPHPTRLVRWFGDPELERNMAGDDYFSRQDLDVDFRDHSREMNRANIALVDSLRHLTKLVICSTAPENVVERTAAFDRYWWCPLVDDPEREGLTRRIIAETGLPAMNTGGNVGTAAWVFALTVLKIQNIAVVGMDLGYHKDTPIEQTQTYPQLKDRKNLAGYFPRFGDWYTDPTYSWYRQNLLDLVAASGTTLTNCTGGGLLSGPGIEVMELERWLKFCS
jgi:hypothetical protein